MDTRPNDQKLRGVETTEAATPRDATVERDDVLADAVEDFLKKLEQGKKPSREEYLTRYPDVAEELDLCLQGLEFVHYSNPSSGSGSLETDHHDSATLQPLATLGDYRIIREIGRGGMGVVYEAEQLSLARRVAMKVLPFAAVLDPRQLQRFKNEALAAAALRHPNIVGVYSVGCERGVHFYAMELVEGNSLAQVLSESGGGSDGSDASEADVDTSPLARLSTQRSSDSLEYFRSIAKLGLQAAEALEYAHQMGVVHRDIKPSNLLIDINGHLSVTDLGLAQMETDSSLTITGDLLGTLRYMSPEQAAGNRRVLDHRTDIYSLGVTLYELITGRPAFEGNDRRKLLCDIADRDPPPPRSVSKQIPHDLETIILRATSKRPTARYATMADLAADLERFLEHQPIHARRPSRAARAARWLQRHRLGMTISSLLTLAIIATVLVISPWTIWSGAPALIGSSELLLHRAYSGGIDTSGGISPDGKCLSFANWASADIAILDLEGGGARDVTTDGTWDAPEQYGEASVWSPDGKQLAYLWYLHDDSKELRVVSSDGTGRRTLYRSAELESLWPMSWSADGAQVLTYQKTADGTGRLSVIATDDGGGTILKSFPHGGPTGSRLGPGSEYVVYAIESPDDDSRRDLYILNTRTRNDWPLAAHPAEDWSPNWTPDGRWIVFLSNRRGTTDLWAIRIVDGRGVGEPQLVKEQVGDVRPMGFSTAGKYFFARRRLDSDLYTASVDFQTARVISPVKKLATHFDEINLIGDWSRDGNRLAFLSRGDNIQESAKLTIHPLEMGQERQWSLERPLDGLSRPKGLQWLPDGTGLIVTGRVTGSGGDLRRLGFFKVDANNGRVTSFLPNELTGFIYRFVFSRDGQYLYFVRGPVSDATGHINRLDLKTGERQQIYDRPSEDYNIVNLALSPDDQQLAFTIGGDLRVVPAGGGDVREVVGYSMDSEIFARWVLAWSPDSRAVVYGRRARDGPGPVALWQVPIAGSAPKALGITMRNLEYLRVHPDGQQILFKASGAAERSELWVIDNLLAYLNSKE